MLGQIRTVLFKTVFSLNSRQNIYQGQLNISPYTFSEFYTPHLGDN